jgi:hypothetical protein
MTTDMSLQLRITVTKATKPEQVKKKDGTIFLTNKGVSMSKSFLVGTYQDGEYSKSIAFECVDKTADTASSFPVGTTLDVTFNIESREWKGKFFTSAKIWKFENIEKPEDFSTAPTQRSNSGGYAPSVAPPEDVDDLPF